MYDELRRYNYVINYYGSICRYLQKVYVLKQVMLHHGNVSKIFQLNFFSSIAS